VSTSPSVALVRYIPVKAGPFFVVCVLNPRNLLRLYDPVPVVVFEWAECRFGAAVASTPNLFSPFSSDDFIGQFRSPKHFSQMLWAKAYTGFGTVHD
jgi:hypothetical protein